MKCSFFIFSTFLCSCLFGQNFEGSMSYLNYSIIEGDTIESSQMTYWIKNNFYKHQGSVARMPLVDLGTLYADAAKMSRINLSASGKVEVIDVSTSSDFPLLELTQLNEETAILGFKCKKWALIEVETQNLISHLWITEEIDLDYNDEFAALFNYQSTLFPYKGLKGWILKREDYRRENQIFVSEAKIIEQKELSLSEMMFY